MKTVNRISEFFSAVFQPIFMPFLGVLLMLLLNATLNDTIPIETRKYIVIISFLFTIILPGLMFSVFFKVGWVSDFNISERKERILPTFIVLLLFFILYYLVRVAEGINIKLVSILLGSIGGILIANLVTLFWKISIHALAVFGVVGSLFAIALATNEPISLITYISFVIASLVGVSRIILNRHTPMQVIMGSILGFLTPFLASVYSLYL